MLKKIFVLSILFFISFSLVSAQGEIVGTEDATVCCEKTVSGLYCQDVPANECTSDRQPPTSCSVTSFCQTGWCYDSNKGTCLDNTPQMVCSDQGGTWSPDQPAVCNLGCCVLDDQAALITLTECKYLSGNAGIETNWDSSITDATQCVLTAGNREKGACVYWQDFDKTCKFTTRENCEEGFVYEGTTSLANTNTQGVSDIRNQFEPAPPTENNNQETGGVESDIETENSGTTPTTPTAILALVSAQEGNGTGEVQQRGIIDFYPGKLCTADELGTNCAPTENTICLPGKEEVYFVDTCGNAANIYDSSKVRNDAYWTNIVDKEDSCGFGESNEDSQSCGNCNYLGGSFCREAKDTQATYGDYICQSLNCVDPEGKSRTHGESWCEYDGGEDGKPGSRAYRELCINGEIIVEACADYRQEECLESSSGGFSQAACRVNRWQDCTAQTDEEDCANTDKRDCKWIDGIEYVLFGSIMNGTTFDGNSIGALGEAIQAQGGLDSLHRGACVPKIPPGFNQATDEGAAICAQANAVCPVKYEKGLLDDEWTAVEHEQCLPGGPLEQARAELCMSLGDCGPKVNYVGQKGSGPGYEIKQQEVEEEDE